MCAAVLLMAREQLLGSNEELDVIFLDWFFILDPIDDGFTFILSTFRNKKCGTFNINYNWNGEEMWYL